MLYYEDDFGEDWCDAFDDTEDGDIARRVRFALNNPSKAVLNERGEQIGSTCNCEDYPCCGH